MKRRSPAVYAGHHVLYGAIFSGGIHSLKNQQKSPAILCVELLLHVTEERGPFFE